MAHTIKNAKMVQKKSKTHTITQVNDTTFTVTSGSSGNSYTVNLIDNGATCSCEWSRFRPAKDRRSGCSHVVSVFNHLTQQAGRAVSVWASEEDAKRQRRPTIAIGDGITLSARKVGGK